MWKCDKQKGRDAPMEQARLGDNLRMWWVSSIANPRTVTTLRSRSVSIQVNDAGRNITANPMKIPGEAFC